MEPSEPVFQVPQDADFVVEALPGQVAPEGLVDAPVKADAHEGPGGVFDLMHGGARDSNVAGAVRPSTKKWAFY